MDDYPDNELINMVCENNEDARDILYDKYKYIVTSILKKYMSTARFLNIDYAELKQEALVGFSDALVNYDQDKDASISTFISLCIERRLSNYIKRMSTIKEKMNKDTISLDEPIDDEHSLYEVIGSDSDDPLLKMEYQENIKAILDSAEDKLSDSEKDVFDLMLLNYSNYDISQKLNIPIKSVYNTVARIRSKLRN